MLIEALKTHTVLAGAERLSDLLEHYIQNFQEQEILAISSKIVALCQGRVVSPSESTKAALVEAESTCFLPAAVSRYGVYLTIKENALMPYAGIDESNSNGYYVLWPEYPQQTADQIWETLRRRFGLRHAGVILTDSRPLPLRWGVTGFAVAHSGFRALRDYRGQPDLFGRPLRMTQANLADALAAAAVLAMGEGNESTPLARITGVPAIEFQDQAPSPEELANLSTRREDDLYAPLLDSVPWQHGQS